MVRYLRRRASAAALVLTASLALAGCGPGSASAAPAEAAVAGAADPAVAAAAEALAQGQAWRATRLIAPVLADSARRTPEAVHLASTAATGWGGWREVRELLTGAEWLDTLYQGAGRAQLARASLELGDAEAAARYAARAVEQADDSILRGERLVVLARALDRLDRRGEAAEAYVAAAEGLPEIADWLRLRAAAVTDDPALRALRLAGVTGSAAVRRLPDAEVEARRRSGELAAAARLLDSLGDPAGAARVRLTAAGDSAAFAAARAELLALVKSRSGSSAAREATDALDAMADSVALTPAEELLIARSAVWSGPVASILEPCGMSNRMPS